MKLDHLDLPMLFSNTELPDIFFTEYLPEASGEAIKIYLYISFLSKYGKDIKLNDLSKKLAIPFPVIQSSLTYWEEKGVITKKSAGYILNNLQEIELNRQYKPRISLSAEQLEKNAKNKTQALAIDNINNTFFQGIMPSSWHNDISLWFEKYGFDEQVMIALFRYCFERSALHRNYVQTVADAWSKNNIHSYEDLDLYYKKQEKLTKMKKSIAKKLGLSRPLTQYEEAYIEKWMVDFNYPFEVIEIALKRTTSKSNPSFDYLDKLISDWNDHNLKTPEDIQNFLIEFKKKKQSIKDLEKKTSSKSNYHNYEQRNYDNLDSLYAN